MKNTTVIILAGGLATRIRTLTENIPKALIPIQNRPFILHQLEKLSIQGFEDIILSIGYKGEMIAEVLNDKYEVRYVSDGDKLLGTGGAVASILAHHQVSDPFIVIYGDSYLPGDYGLPLSELTLRPEIDALMCVYRNEDAFDTSNVEFSQGNIVAYQKKHKTPKMKHIDWGLNIFRHQAFADFKDRDVFDLSEIFARALSKKRLYGHEIFERFYEIGSYRGIEELNHYLQKKRISIVVPVYNEEDNIPVFVTRIEKLFTATASSPLRNYDYEIIFSLDPSSDRSEEIICNLNSKNPRVKLLKFARRFGQPIATFAAITHACGEAVVVIDVDLQDPPEVIADLVVKWQEGYDVVYAKRRSRQGETLLKRIVAAVGYYVIGKITALKIPRDTGDFRLLDQRVVQELGRFKEQNPFLRGLTAYVGFKQGEVLYDRHERLSGQGKYNRFFGSLTIGLNGIFCFSHYPLHLISWMGISISCASFLLALIYFCLKMVNYHITWGNPTLVILISFIGGMQLLSLGIIGQYLARIFDATIGRPLYIIDKKVDL